MDENWSRYNINCDPFDVRAFEGVLDESRKLRQTLDPKRLVTAPQLGQDVFSSLYKYVPKLRDPAEVAPEYQFNRGLIEKAMGTQEYARLRAMTQLQETESALATEIISSELLQQLPEEDRQAVNDYAKAEGKLNDALDKLKALEELKKVPPKLAKFGAALQKKVPGLQQAVQQAQAGFQQACSNPSTMAALRAAMGAAGQELEMVNDFAGGWGMGPGQLTKLPSKDRMELMRRVQQSAKIRELNKLMGRFRRLAFQKRYTRVTVEPSEVVDITMGNDLSKVVPSELAALADPELEDLFFYKYAQARLMQYEMKGRETFGRGPIIICIDNSGSMAAGVGGITAEMWAKAMGLAMAEIALRDKRTIEFINFSSREEISKTVIEHTLAPAERLNRMVKVAEEFFNGGTDFERPLEESVRDIEKQQFKKADVIMVTDGIADFSEGFLKYFKKVKEEKQFRLHSVIIGGTAESLEKVSDEVHKLYDLLSQGDAVAGNIFESV